MRPTGYSALALSVIGAVLDFTSAYQAAPMAGGLMVDSYYAEATLFILGVVVLAAGVMPLLAPTSWSMRRSGLTMEVLGVAMVLVSSFVPDMDALVSYAMLIVGGLMIINGMMMQRRPKEGAM